MKNDTVGLIVLLGVVAVVGYLIYTAYNKNASTSISTSIGKALGLDTSSGETVTGDLINGVNAVTCSMFGINCDAQTQ